MWHMSLTRPGANATARVASLCILLAAGSTTAALAAEQPGLTIEQATRLALAQPSVARWMQARVAGAEAAAAAASAWNSPVLDLGTERLVTGPAGDELTLVVGQTLDLSGRRGLLRRAGKARAEAARQRGHAARIDLVARVRRLFYRALHLQRRDVVLAGWSDRLQRAISLIDKRIAAGESSRYDRQRLQGDMRAARTAATTNSARLAAARARLAGATGTAVVAATAALLGALLPSAPPETLDAAALATGRPRTQALSHDIQASSLQGDAAGRRWLRTVQLRGGYLGAGGGAARQHGFILGVSAALPFSARPEARRQAAVARQTELSARRDLARQRWTAEITALAGLARRLQASARDLRTTADPARAAMLRTADVAWRGGELGLVALLDAHRSATDESLRILDLEHQARQAAIALAAASEGSPS